MDGSGSKFYPHLKAFWFNWILPSHFTKLFFLLYLSFRKPLRIIIILLHISFTENSFVLYIICQSSMFSSVADECQAEKKCASNGRFSQSSQRWTCIPMPNHAPIFYSGDRQTTIDITPFWRLWLLRLICTDVWVIIFIVIIRYLSKVEDEKWRMNEFGPIRGCHSYFFVSIQFKFQFEVQWYPWFFFVSVPFSFFSNSDGHTYAGLRRPERI